MDLHKFLESLIGLYSLKFLKIFLSTVNFLDLEI